MIEVPSAAVIADMLAREADFFSIGTNDLIQYSMAVDRGNEKVAYLYEPLHPAILRLIRSVIAAGHENGIPVCVCGEMAADPMVAIILIGMGIDELSMSSVSVPSVKKVIRSIHLTEAKVLVEEILGQSTIEGVKRLVERRLRSYVKQNKIHRRHLREALHTPGAETADE
jgi:phosphotransferase system enzyme I (PtsI)